jgi:hypothetical protein
VKIKQFDPLKNLSERTGFSYPVRSETHPARSETQLARSGFRAKTED